ncbi:MAG: dihydrofolate reductase family protein [Propionibacteriales bacterium]|nr:dihydrofolate reductase family protein [Propionibacteriales bacterium]
MTRTRYSTATTLDGFIATDDHSLDWLLSRETGTMPGDFNFDTFLPQVGAVVMGASTYEWVLAHDAGWSYEQPTWVFTHRQLEVPSGADVRFTQAPIPDVHAEMAESAAGKDIWLVGGGDLVGQFHDHGLLDEVIAAVAPVTIGSGKPLLPRHVELSLQEVAHSGEFACLRYDVIRPA